MAVRYPSFEEAVRAFKMAKNEPRKVEQEGAKKEKQKVVAEFNKKLENAFSKASKSEAKSLKVKEQEMATLKKERAKILEFLNGTTKDLDRALEFNSRLIKKAKERLELIKNGGYEI